MKLEMKLADKKLKVTLQRREREYLEKALDVCRAVAICLPADHDLWQSSSDAATCLESMLEQAGVKTAPQPVPDIEPV